MLKDYVVAITGASAGIGAATARELAGLGARVVLGARRIDRLAELVAELGEDRALAVEMDVRNPADAERLVQAAVDRFGRLDGLVANAGIGYYGSILDHDDETLGEMLEVNVAGTVWPVRAAVRRLLPQGSGDVVIVSSVAGTTARGNEAVYAATKHAQIGLAQGLDRELFTKGIRVTAVCPGGVVTEFAMQPGGGRTSTSPQLKDMLQADDVARAIGFVLQQPRTMRTLIHRLRGATEEE
ncbi:SDR family NAD(P)-dependent oxidoreductase [Microbacterium ulmi]|uniref:SDR family oxidoreductase n=1 Tax=Microbacterium ulmi TaxID=179095 RepID=A0A7Y2LZS5_9MICO|nr:3-oxoacyl-[acyl-carrier protein] reductase [Microbacterium ulmi]NNH03870.1 SDR family oxidoreductase [Microbacterium ulmi]